jgi:hypothetical protein
MMHLLGVLHDDKVRSAGFSQINSGAKSTGSLNAQPLSQAARTGLPVTVRLGKRLGPFEKMLNNLVYCVRMGNGAHVAKILKLHKLNSPQCGR